MMIRSISLLLVMLAGLVVPPDSDAQNSTITYQGQLRQAGQPFTGMADLEFILFDQLTAGTAVGGPVTRLDWPVEDGLFQVELDFGASAFDGSARYLEVRVDGVPLSPRQPVTATPYALLAAGAAAGSIDGVSVDPTEIQLRVVGTCPSDEYVREVNQNGTVVCDSAGGGTVTQVDTGSGLTGGPIADTGTIAIAPAGVGAAEIDATEVQRRVSATCPGGEFVVAINQDGTTACMADSDTDGTVIQVDTGAGLTGGPITESGTVAVAPGGIGATEIDPAQVQRRVAGTCPAGEYVQQVGQDGSVTCGVDANTGGTLTQVDTGAGLTGGPITDTGTIAVAPGGIGTNEIDPAQVQRRVAGTCPAGEYVRQVNADGSVTCGIDGVGTSGWSLSGNAPGPGAFLGTTNAEPLELRAADLPVLRILDADDGSNHAPNLIGGSGLNVLDESIETVYGATIAGGGGFPAAATCGPAGTSPCVNTVAAPFATVLGGAGNYATGHHSTAMGVGSTASGFGATAIGNDTIASAARATAIGDGAVASGGESTALGKDTLAEGIRSTATGYATFASGGSSTAMGFDTRAEGEFSTALGRSTTASGAWSTSMGAVTTASGDAATAMGNTTTASGKGSTAMGESTFAGGVYSLAAGFRARVRDAQAAGEIDTSGQCNVATNDCGDEGTFVWGDSQFANFESTGPDQFLVRAAGGAAINTNTPLAPLTVRGEGKWNPTIGNGYGDFLVGNDTYGLAIGVANGPGAGAGAVRFWPVGGNEAIVFTTATSYPDRTLTLSDAGLVGVRRNPASNALEVGGNASKTVAGDWLANSDARIKTDVREIDGALDRLLQLRPVTFRYTEAYRSAYPEIDEARYYNVIAQEFARVFPDAVKRSGEFLPGLPETPENEILQVDTHPAVITSIAAVQELAVRLERAEARNESLEAELGAIRRQQGDELADLRAELAMLRELVAPRMAGNGAR